MLTEGLISEAALQRVLAEADSPQVRNWVLAVLAAIRERFPRCDFMCLTTAIKVRMSRASISALVCAGQIPLLVEMR